MLCEHQANTTTTTTTTTAAAATLPPTTTTTTVVNSKIGQLVLLMSTKYDPKKPSFDPHRRTNLVRPF